ncbi:hypothetical protein M3644_30265 [Bacillus cereus]|uniref:hypothetical protein n=2 Tax=Bacillus cereus TaxID=1396 RepID=UPI0010BE6503|nr:hypothetical protein [Bacillus cereus]MCM3224016.1 hypothetical protein [Bacillus cereus]TKH16421.1 hypothetical protein FC692_31455 [Bacillus cereus]
MLSIIASFMENKKIKLKRRKSEKKVKYILEIEKMWESYVLADRSEYAFERLLKRLDFVIKKKSKICERKWMKMKITADEFESVFYEAIWKLCDGNDENIGYTSYGVYYFYETLELVLERREIDLVRKNTTKQELFESSTVPLNKYANEFISDEVNIEDEIIDKQFLRDMIWNPLLKKEESDLLSIIYRNPDLSYEKLGRMMGLKHHEKVRRTLKRINKKLNLHKKSVG